MFTRKHLFIVACFIFTLFVVLPLWAQNVSLLPVVTNLDNPTSIANAGDGTERLFITEQDGRILIYDGTQILPAPFLTITDVDDAGSEEGLLGLAFHPEFASNPDKKFFYVNYTTESSQTVIERYTVSADGNSVVANSEEIILSFNQPAGNHNGGHLAFGTDDFLYISSGDGGGSPGNRAQETTNLLGKILRIGVDKDDCPNEVGENYCIPDSNPFGNEIWVLGLRNPWKFSFDDSGNMFIGDVGQGEIEEINYQPVESTGGENYGWQCFEGSNIFDNSCSAITHNLPITFYTHSSGNCSVTGGFRYQAIDIPLLIDDYIYGDFCSGRIWFATEDISGNWSSTLLLNSSINVASFGEDENGEIYVLDNPFIGSGGLYRLVNVDDDFPPPPDNTGAFVESGGLVVMEAENFDQNNSGTTDDWFLNTVQGGFSGTGYMESGPNNGNNINTNFVTNSPELIYLVNFTTTGTYYVWTRACGPGGAADSVHMGINGNESTTANRKKTAKNCSNFTWRVDRLSNAPDATINVESAGVHEINLWMREDGSRVDKILLTTDSGFTPTGAGPTESVRNDDPPPDPEGTNAGECTDGIDNDDDGPIDCADSGCSSDPACIVPPDPEGTNAGECTDGIDNDDDGPIDCADSGCSSDPACIVGGTGAFIESAGQVVMEAENFDQNNTGSSDDWFLNNSQGGFSGTGYMESGPNNGNNINTNFVTNSPELIYLVNFTTTGTYYAWTRACGPGGAADSVHMGIDGNESTTANRKKTAKNCSNFTWRVDRLSNAPDATINVGSPGFHEINLWMREDGSRVDKILLTTDSGFTPAGAGPAESPREVTE